jgi:hypothetical protein
MNAKIITDDNDSEETGSEEGMNYYEINPTAPALSCKIDEDVIKDSRSACRYRKPGPANQNYIEPLQRVFH